MRHAAWLILLLFTMPAPLHAAEPPPRRPDPGAATPDPFEDGLGIALPPGWTISKPQEDLGQMQSVVEVPGDWRGNPAAIAASLCPGPDSPVWQKLGGLRLVVHYRDHRYPGYDCTP